MTDQISAKEYSLWELMSSFIFNIPDYQRPYSWTENEALTLWDDLIDFWQENRNKPSQTYFIGSVVLVNSKGSPESEVIDGQQRISTLSIILSIIRDYSMNLKNDIRKCLWQEGIQHKKIADRPRLSLRHRDADFFKCYVAQNNTKDLIRIDPRHLDDDAQRLIQKNAKVILDRARSLFENNPDNVESFVTVLFNQCFFVVVTTPDNESAFRVFSVMNNRGLSLLPSDIIKAHIIGDIDEETRQYYSNKWEDIEVDLGRESFNSLLSHIRMIYGKCKLHGTLVNEFEKNVFKHIKEKEKVITEVIEPYAQAYKAILKCEYESSFGAEEVNEKLYWMNRVDDSDWIPVAMYIFAKQKKDAIFVRDCIQKLERLVSYFYITSCTSNQRIERYSKILYALEINNHQEVFRLLNLLDNEKMAFIDVLDGDIYLLPARKRTYVILHLDYFVSDKAAKYKNNIFSIEHVLPQNPKPDSEWIKQWPDEDDREFWLHKISNLIPLTRKKNSQAQNYDFSEKKKKYFSEKNGITTYALATEIMSETEWTIKVVSERQKRLIGIFTKYWELFNEETVTDKKSAKRKDSEQNVSTELLQQMRLKEALKKFFAENPLTLLPKLPKEDVKVGEYVHRAVHQLSISGYELTNEQIQKLCSIEESKKYTHRNLPFLVAEEDAQTDSNMMKRYWKTKSYIETFNGKKYYVYSQWYPDHKISKDAHKSDFLQLYLDIALGEL